MFIKYIYFPSIHQISIFMCHYQNSVKSRDPLGQLEYKKSEG